MSTMQEQVLRLARRLFFTHLAYVMTAVPALTYLVAVSGGFVHVGAWKFLGALLVFVVAVFGLGLPYLVVKASVEWALKKESRDDGERLVGLLKLPRVVELRILGISCVGAVIYIFIPALYYGLSVWRGFGAFANFLVIFLLVQVQERLSFERAVQPDALEEFRRSPGSIDRKSGLFWVRQSWYLPYAFGLFVACSIVIAATIVASQAESAYGLLVSKLKDGQADGFLALVDEAIGGFTKGAIAPVILIGAYLLVNAGLAAWRLAQAQAEAARSVQAAMEALASGTPRLPDWISTDEIGDLSVATARVFEQLKTFSLSLGESADALKRSAEELGMSTSRQSEVLTLQATALQETQVTAQEIKQTSILASQKAEGVLQQTERADGISQAGSEAIQKSLGGLLEIGGQVRDMASRIKSLEERTRQIANITTTVKDLADQSNMLALNAAIEAVRSGEHGKGFGIVAREIRALADQSIKATNGVRDILQDITEAIRSTVKITEQGAEKLEVSLKLVREFSGNIQQLAGIVRDNASAVRQITAAVTQQNAGIGQIFQAVNDLSKIMDQTMAQLRASDDAVALVRSVADKVTGFVGNYSWERMGGAQPAAGAPKLPPGTGSR